MKTLIFAFVVFAALTGSATQYSKLAIITAAKKAGVWANLKAFIAEADLKDEWDACQYLTDDYPQFAAATNMLIKTGMATAEQVGAIFSSSVDAAVSDAAISRYYANDMKTKAGRSKWHGKVVRTVVDTNTWTKATYFEDGTVFTDKAKVTTAITAAQAARAKVMLSTNNVPAKLAQARRKLAAEAGITNTVNLILKSGE